MNRLEFLKTCGYACLSGVAITTLFSQCATALNLDIEPVDGRLSISEKEFELEEKGQVKYREYILLHSNELQFPICVYRTSEGYHSLLLKCTHQGAELRVFGERIVCPAHGAEFNKNGGVEEGPAEESLIQLPTSVQNNQILIQVSK